MKTDEIADYVEGIMKTIYPEFEGGLDDSDINFDDDVFNNNQYFEKFDKALSKPQTEPNLERSTEISYFV